MQDSFLNSGVGFIAQVQEERAGQIRREGFTAAHDDEHTQGEIAQAAALYAMPDSWRTYEMVHRLWPWHPQWWKPAAIPDRPQARQRELIKAAALLYAEWDRLERHILQINAAPTNTLVTAAIIEPEILPLEPGQTGYGGYDPNNPPPLPDHPEPEDISPDHPFYNLIKKAQVDKKTWDCEACEIEAYNQQVKQMPRHTCGKDGSNDLHQQQLKKIK